VKNIIATLAIVWRIAVPYFRSEDKWVGRGLLAAVIAMELALVAIDVLVNQCGWGAACSPPSSRWSWRWSRSTCW